MATCALYKITLKISEHHLAAFIACLLFICCIKIQWWNNYILTEPLFINTNILFFIFFLNIKTSRGEYLD